MSKLSEIAEDVLAYGLNEAAEHNLTEGQTIDMLEDLRDLIEKEIADLEEVLEDQDEDDDSDE